MALDQTALVLRLKQLAPRGWFPETASAPIIDGVMTAFASVAQHFLTLTVYAQAQSRIATASDGFLDVLAFDFFGFAVQRLSGQSDISFRKVILLEILRERATRAGIQKSVADLTGFDVRMFEGFNTFDTGGYDTGYLGFDMLGRWGSLDMPFQVLIATLQPIGVGIPNVGGFDSAFVAGGYDLGAEEYGDISQVSGPVTNQKIFDCINSTRAAGITCWVAIGLPPEARLDVDFALDQSELV